MSREYACTYDSFTVYSAGANRTAGWKFTPTEDIQISAIRIKGSATYETVAQIWRQNDSFLLMTTNISCQSGQWIEKNIPKLYLYKDVTYIISHNVYTSFGYYGTSSKPASSFYSAKLNYSTIGDLRINAINTMPDTASGYYLAIDFVIAPEEYFSSGFVVYELNDIHAVGIVESAITWQEDLPEGTNILVSISKNGENYTTVESSDPVSEIGLSLDALYIKIEMTTTNLELTPSLSNLKVQIQSANDVYSVIVSTMPNRRFCSAVNDISLSYSAEIGNLAGIGGPVDSFSVTFSPEDLISKPHQNPQEHLEISDISAEGNLIPIYYSDTKCDEHIEISDISAVGVLTHIDDI